MSPGNDTSEPFFHRRSTHAAIDELSALTDVVLYVGAGASVERTGLTWMGLTAQLLDPSMGSYSDRIELARTISPLMASSVVAAQYAADSDQWRGRLEDAIRRQLYRGSSRVPSYFNDRVAALARDYFLAGVHAVLVTPNYDTFLIDAAKSLLDTGGGGFTAVKSYVFGVPGSAGAEANAATRLAELEEDARDPDTLCVVSLHGLVTQKPANDPLREDVYAVVSEADYAATREQSRRVLATLFENRDVVVVGSSLTDPPLIHALLTTKESDRRRFSISPKQGSDRSRVSDEAVLDEAEKLRADHLGVKNVVPDFYYQAPQILEEVRVDLRLENAASTYSSVDTRYRYGHRLNAWWDEWSAAGGDQTMVERQHSAYMRLFRALPAIRDILGSPPEEDLGIEAWIRWRPEERRLALFASSHGSWPDMNTMKYDAISSTSRYTAVRAFTNGAPTFAVNDDLRARWRSFFGRPIRLVDRHNVHLPVGAICIASTRPKETSSLSPRNQTRTDDLIAYLEGLGLTLFYANAKKVDE